MDPLENSDKETCDKLRKLFQSDPSALIRKLRRQKREGEIKVGDVVFWYTYDEFVIIEELPPHSPRRAIVRLSSGGLRETPISTLWKWWQGNEKDEDFLNQTSRKLSDDEKKKIKESFKLFRSRDWYETLKIKDITDERIVKIQLEDEFASFDETRKMAHFTIEQIIKLTVPVVKAVIVEFIYDTGPSHMVGY